MLHKLVSGIRSLPCPRKTYFVCYADKLPSHGKYVCCMLGTLTRRGKVGFNIFLKQSLA